jgi:hypothetical protein
MPNDNAATTPWYKSNLDGAVCTPVTFIRRVVESSAAAAKSRSDIDAACTTRLHEKLKLEACLRLRVRTPHAVKPHQALSCRTATNINLKAELKRGFPINNFNQRALLLAAESGRTHS